VAGFLGSLIATLAIYIPSSVVVYFATTWWQRNEGSAWRSAIERGLAPVAVGLIFAGAVAVLQAAHAGLLALATTAATTAVLYFSKISPYAVVGVVAALYLALQFL
ncbi:MAG TPA: chromate transporter, partial [Xanthobacteraceae bacterium]|nr:chromate transporter [Xanthobacteraceae bacterium]